MVQALVWAARNNAKASGAQRGDLIGWLEDGVHPEKRVVGGPLWNDPVDFSTVVDRSLTPAEMLAGVRPDYNVLDVPGVSVEQARLWAAQGAASELELTWLPRRLMWFPKLSRIDPKRLSDDVRAELRARGRAEISPLQLRFALTLKESLTLEKIRAWITNDGRFPAEWTTEE